MAIIQFKWEVPNLSSLLAAGFDQQKIEAEVTPPAWTELTRVNNRLPLVANVERYLWECPSSISYDFRVVPYRSSDDAEDTPISITSASVRGYCTVQDLRDEGYANPPYTDVRIQNCIDRATRVIDRICGQRFDAYYAVVTLDVRKLYDEHHLDVPIAALFKIQQDDQDLSLGDILVYNRHLTQGLSNPDDRQNPMIAWGDDNLLFTGITSFSGGRFTRGRKRLRLYGVFGYTELGDDDSVGETALNSQIPLSWGSTPLEIKHACMILTSGYLNTLADGGDDSIYRTRLRSETTQDQSYTLASGPEAESAFGMTGNQIVDSILMRYCCPVRIGAV